MLEYLTDTKVLIAAAVVVVLLVAAAGVYWWRSRTAVSVPKPALKAEESTPEPVVEKPAPISDMGQINCPDCNEPMVIASEDKTVRKCLRCDKAYEVSVDEE